MSVFAMKNVSVLLLLFAFPLWSVAQDKAFSWLNGTWKLEGKSVYEVWTAGKQLPTGKSYKVNAGDTIMLEKMSLRKKGDDYFYVPDVAENKGEVEFKMTEITASGFVAENPQHDFPKIIRYKLIRKDGWVGLSASIEGNGKVINYSFSKVD